MFSPFFFFCIYKWFCYLAFFSCGLFLCFLFQSSTHLTECVAVFLPFCFLLEFEKSWVSLHYVFDYWFILFTCCKYVQNFCLFLNQFCSLNFVKNFFISSWLSNFFWTTNQLFTVFSCCCLVVKSCPTFCSSMDYSMAGFSVLHISQRLLKFMSTEPMMLSNHLILCHPLLLLPSVFTSMRVFSSESALQIRWPKYWSLSFSIRPSNIQGWPPLELTDLISLQSKGLSRVFSSTTIWKHQFFSAQLSLWSNSHIHTWLLEKP